MATPDPTQVAPWYLRNITQALELDEATGNVFIRTNAAILGNVTVGNVAIGSLGNIDLSHTYMPVSVTGNITGITDPVSVTGNVGIVGNVGILGNVNVTQGTTPWSVTGNVNIGSMPEVEIKNDVGNAIPVTSNYNVFTVGFAPTQTDAFGRLRVSNPFTLFDSFHRFQDNGKVNTYTANGGTSTYDAAAGTVLMNVTTTSGSEVMRESSRVFAYQPGKSLLVLQTFVMGPTQANLRIRQGYYDASNGFYIQRLGDVVSLVKRSSSSGSLVNTVVNQADWNVDPMDGNGPSGISLDFSKAQIMWHDLEWLGVGTVRVGFVVNGIFYPVHYWNHANIVTTTYMTTACLPVRAEITATSTLSTTATHTLICTSVISEGGYQLNGRTLSAGHLLATPVRLPNDGSMKPVMSIRLKSTRLQAIVLPTNFTFSPVAQSTFKYQIYIGAVTSGGSWTDAGANSSVEYNLAPTALVSGTPADTSFLVSSNQSSAAPSLSETPFTYQLERNTFTGVAYEFVIMAATTGTNQDVYASMGWEEVT